MTQSKENDISDYLYYLLLLLLDAIKERKLDVSSSFLSPLFSSLFAPSVSSKCLLDPSGTLEFLLAFLPLSSSVPCMH
jgi:hypothetical protein